MHKTACDSFASSAALVASRDDDSIESGGLEIRVSDGVAVIRVTEPLLLEWHYPMWFTGYNQIADAMDAAFQDPRIDSILLHIDSPGGEVAGLADFCSRFAGRNPKRVVAYGDLFTSAAYAIVATLANSIVLSQTGSCGHVGVYQRLVNVSRAMNDAGYDVRYVQAGARKTDGFDDVPLTDIAVESIQASVDHAYEVMCGIVARGRNMTPNAVKATEARVYFGQQAVTIGFADAIGTFADAYRIAKGGRVQQSNARQSVTSAPVEPAGAPEPSAPIESTNARATVQQMAQGQQVQQTDVRVAMESNVANDAGVNPMPMTQDGASDSGPTIEIEVPLEPMPQFEPGALLEVSNGPLKGQRVIVASVSECTVCYSVTSEAGESMGDMCESMLQSVSAESPAPVEPAVPSEPMAPEMPVDPGDSEGADGAKCKPGIVGSPDANGQDVTLAAARMLVSAALPAANRGRVDMIAGFVTSTLKGDKSVKGIEDAIVALKQSDPALFAEPVAPVVATAQVVTTEASAAPEPVVATAPVVATDAPATPKRGLLRFAATPAPKVVVAAMAAPAVREAHVAQGETKAPKRFGGLVGRN
jgi:ClpP class serine protease